MSTPPTQPLRDFETTLQIDAPRDVVWEAISTDAGLRRWFAPRVEVVPGEGGSVCWQWGDIHTWPQTIEAWEPGRRLRTRYDSAVDDGRGGRVPLFIEWTLDGEGGTTTLRLVQSGFGSESSFDTEYDGISRGWPIELRSLRLSLERHRGSDRQIAWSLADLDVPHEEAWKRITGPQGFACGEQIDRLTEGDPFRIETADGDVFEGTTLTCFPHQFSGMDARHGDAFVRFTVEDCGGKSQAWLWLGAYDRPKNEVAGIQERWDAMLRRLFVGKVQAAAHSA